MKKLRIAIINYPLYIFDWQKAIINNLIDSNFSEIVLNLDFHEEMKELQNSTNAVPVFFKSYLKIDSKFFKPVPNALAKTDKSDKSDKINNITTLSITKTIDIKSLEEYELDIILNLTELTLNNEIVDKAKYGVWFLNFCDLNYINKRPYGIWEMLEKRPEMTGVLRYIKTGMTYPKTIDQTFSCTDGLSYKRNLNDILWQSHFLVGNNIELLSKNEELFNKKLLTKSGIYPENEITVPFSPPSNTKMLKFAIALYAKKLFQVIKSKIYFNQWALIFLNNSNSNENPYDLKHYKKILPPKDRFWADPFLIKHNNKTYLFIEELIYKNKLGHLAVMEIDNEGNYSKPETILVKDYHLSYPFIFKEDDEFYMIPETSGNNDIQLYKATDFPLKWELQKVMMNNVVAVDTTLYKEHDTYWMFTNLKKHKGGSKHVELNLFYSKSLLADHWEPHSMNPIVTSVKTARPAGKLFIKNNKLYRPSQDCSSHYGYGLNISEITKLNPNNYEEKLVEAIKPNWDKSISCTHSFNSAEELYISDIKINRNRFLP
ncbi:hypothetical protein HNV08_08790 [Winogradskyella eckloniae]|uniref:glucosamine inositolphosphorylceramide transferase family protein n=1 Tax=Winogradskyella eckloniae TaxID=1089306 RepID=UPI0015667872|nr:hypothetical protein [Winogradskyella eckloniae]NRD20145.1 hypothetical protein [Winogradskyella eckloniae]